MTFLWLSRCLGAHAQGQSPIKPWTPVKVSSLKSCAHKKVSLISSKVQQTRDTRLLVLFGQEWATTVVFGEYYMVSNAIAIANCRLWLILGLQGKQKHRNCWLLHSGTMWVSSIVDSAIIPYSMIPLRQYFSSLSLASVTFCTTEPGSKSSSSSFVSFSRTGAPSATELFSPQRSSYEGVLQSLKAIALLPHFIKP